MGFLYQHDGERLQPEFKCPCGSTRAERVKVKRQDGSDYETEFARCYRCAAVYHFPGALPAFIPTGGPPESYGAVAGSGGPPQLTSEQYAEIMSAAARARKSRRRR